MIINYDERIALKDYLKARYSSEIIRVLLYTSFICQKYKSEKMIASEIENL